MTAPKHTPGPWQLQDQIHTGTEWGRTPKPDDWRFGYRIAAKDNCHLAQVGHVDARYKESAEANARLIAAAPDLLQALEELVAETENNPALNYHALETAGFDMAHAALRKARGADA